MTKKHPLEIWSQKAQNFIHSANIYRAFVVCLAHTENTVLKETNSVPVPRKLKSSGGDRHLRKEKHQAAHISCNPYHKGKIQREEYDLDCGGGV